jgi:DNA-binding transcriptional regulator LsrR (DeoR family)
MTLTKISQLNRMQYGHKYTATQLAHLFSVSRVTVLGMLRTLVDEGQLQVTRTNSRVIHFTRELPDSLQSGGADTRAVATFPVTRNLQGCLSNYDQELVARSRLALLARDRCR